jgi:hypothetical protein
MGPSIGDMQKTGLGAPDKAAGVARPSFGPRGAVIGTVLKPRAGPPPKAELKAARLGGLFLLHLRRIQKCTGCAGGKASLSAAGPATF